MANNNNVKVKQVADNVFEISVDDHSYRMALPHWETDYIQGRLANTHEPYELEMLRAMAAVLKPGELVLDVGANIGNHSMYLAVVAECRVCAFEPNLELSRAFNESVMLNDLGGLITVHPEGVGVGPTMAHFANHMPDNLGGQSLTVDGSEESDITVIALDSLVLKDKVRAIKIDVEGMEQEVLEGARQLISRDKPNLFIEAQTESDFELLHEVVVELGYVYWDTFNATPTHWFIHKDEFGENAIIDHYFEKGRDSYKLRLAMREVQKRLNEANEKYRNANERIDELKGKLNAANEKYKSLTAQSLSVRDQLKAENEKLRGELRTCESRLQSENPSSGKWAGGFDFSVDGTEIG